MTNNRVATAREDLSIVRSGTKPSTFRPSNFPQTGRLRVIERNNKFQTIIFGERELPEYIRVGKFMSKVRIDIIAEPAIQLLPLENYVCNTYLNSGDLPTNLQMLAFDLISIPPVSLLKNLRFRGAAWRIGDFTLPANLLFCGGRNG
jgi:CRISPR-associated protein Csc1